MRRGDPGRLAVWLAILAVGAELTVSANLLTVIGVPYVTDGGTPFAKFHPGTWLLTLACLAALGGGRQWLLRLDHVLVGFLILAALCVFWAWSLTGAGNLIVLLDTFLPAGLLACVLARTSEEQIEPLRRLMQVALAANAILALAEAAEGDNLVPLYLNGAVYVPHGDEFRPTALFDHPLTGAVMMMIGLALAPRGRWGRLPYQALLWGGLIVFGGRMALAASSATALAGGAGLVLKLLLARDRRAGFALVAGLGAVSAFAVIAAAAVAGGLGQRVLGHLYWDPSAQARLAQWQILARLDGWDLLFGTKRDMLLAKLNALRLAAGVEVIENFWLLMFAALGAIGFPIFVAMLGALCLWCWRRSAGTGRVLLVSVLLVASTSNSLGRKSTVLVCLVAGICCCEPGRSAKQVARNGFPAGVSLAGAR